MVRFALGAFAMVLATAAGARDLNRQNYLVGERAAGMGGAFVSLAGDATSAFYNPAGLGGLFRKGLSLSASAYQLSIEDTPRVLDIDMGGGSSIRGDMKSSTFATFPASIAYVLPLGDATESAPKHHVLAFSVLVPDQDKLHARVDVPSNDYLFDFQGALLSTDLTYWIGPSYAVQLGGRLRLGVSVFALAYLTETQVKTASKVVDGAAASSYMTTSLDISGTSLSMLLQAGVQWDVTPNFTLGLTARTPTLGRLWSSVTMLRLDNFYSQDAFGFPQPGGYADRIEVKEGVTLERRLPLMVAVGLSYRVPDRFAIALDGTLHLAQPQYRQFEGPLMYPRDASGNLVTNDPRRVLDPVVEAKARQVVNANVGLEVNLTKKILARLGAFTNLSSVDRAFAAPDANAPVIDRLGLSLGAGVLGERSTTSFTIVYSGGRGSVGGFNDAFAEPQNRPAVTAHTVTAMLSGSADL